MSTTHEQILELVKIYSDENEKFVTKGIKASAGRARKALSQLSKAVKVRRGEIQEAKVAMAKQ